MDPTTCNPATGSYDISNTSYNVTLDNVDPRWGSDLVANNGSCSALKHLIPASITTEDEVNHTYDIGLVSPQTFDLALSKRISANNNPKIGEDVTFNIQVFNQGDVVATEVEITDYINDNYSFDAAKNPQWTLANGMAKYLHTSPLAPNNNFSVSITLTLVDNDVQSYENFAEISNTIDQFGNTNSDVDSKADDDNTNLFLIHI